MNQRYLSLTIFMGTILSGLLCSGCYESVSHKNGDVRQDQEKPDISSDFSNEAEINPVDTIDQMEILIDVPVDGSVCFANSDCMTDHFCEFPEGQCSGPGYCRYRGDGMCPAIHAPVCGCDNKTYGNDCLRVYAGVGLLHRGECGTVTSCRPWDPASCPPSQFCEGPSGMCYIDGGTGWCEPLPGECDIDPNEQPVCGCDGITYPDDCRRKMARVWLNHVGECSSECYPGDPYRVCNEGEFCEGPVGMCHVTGATGWCQKPDAGCGYLYDPVCGCDNVTYPNDCERQAHGVWLNHRGPCDDEPPGRLCGRTLPSCLYGEFCEFPPGDCGWSGRPGFCTVMPDVCPEYYSPVCGCDGRTYDNDCYRQNAGVSLCYNGVCSPFGCTPE